MKKLDDHAKKILDKIIKDETDPITGKFHLADVYDEAMRKLDEYDERGLVDYLLVARHGTK